MSNGVTAARLDSADLLAIAELIRVSLDDQGLIEWHPRLREIQDKMIKRIADTLDPGNRTTTPGPWGLRGSQIRAAGGTGAHVATYQISRDDGFLIAAAPALFDALRRLLACQPNPMFPGGKLHDACVDARQALNDADPLMHRGGK